MKNKPKKIAILLTLILLIFLAGITYSLFRSNAALESEDQNIAKFVFDAQNLDQIQLPLVDLKPGDTKIFPFAVTNTYSGNKSDITVRYQMTVKTYHLMPLVIELYKVVDTTEELILTCNESFARNASNELICNAPLQELGFATTETDNYNLKVAFPSNYNTEEYKDLVDYINLDIKSEQKQE